MHRRLDELPAQVDLVIYAACLALAGALFALGHRLAHPKESR